MTRQPAAGAGDPFAEMWVQDPQPGGYVCAVPDPAGPDGLCGYPVESEPCPVHVPAGAPEPARPGAISHLAYAVAVGVPAYIAVVEALSWDWIAAVYAAASAAFGVFWWLDVRGSRRWREHGQAEVAPDA